jgi:hypothetical protein
MSDNKDNVNQEINQEMPQAGGLGLGITKETKAENNVSMLPPTKLEHPTPTFPTKIKFPVARLVNIVAKKDFETKNGNTDVLQFVFRDSEGRQFIHTEWKQDPTDEKYAKKVEGINSRIKHIYMQVFGTFPEQGIATNPTSFLDFFEKVAKAFKGESGIPKTDMWIKLIYYKGNLSFPLTPNFLQRIEKDKPCKLEVTLAGKYKESISQEDDTSIPNIPGAGSAGGDMPSFEGEYN